MVLTTDSVFSLAALESKLVAYVSDTDAFDTPFDTSSLPKISREQAQLESARAYCHQYLLFAYFNLIRYI